MSAIPALGIVTLVLGFMITILGPFPIPGVTASSETVQVNEFSTEAVQQAADKFSVAYTSVIDDLVSYIKDPDLNRAESRRQAMVAYANYLVPKYKNLSQELQGQLDTMVAQANQTTDTTTSTTTP